MELFQRSSPPTAPSSPPIPARPAADCRLPTGLLIELIVPRSDHHPIDLLPWAKCSGFIPSLSGKSSTTSRGAAATPTAPSAPPDAPSSPSTAPPDSGHRRWEVADLESELIHDDRGESRGIVFGPVLEPLWVPMVDASVFYQRFAGIEPELWRGRVEAGPRVIGVGDGDYASTLIAGVEGLKRVDEIGGDGMVFVSF